MTTHPSLDPEIEARAVRAAGPGGLRAALAASGIVGTWHHDIWADRLTVTVPLARLLGLGPEAGARGRPLAELLAATHGDDRARLENTLHAAIARGGRFAVAFRTASSARWLDLRGRIEPDAAGRPTWGHGIVLDHTEERAEAGQDRDRTQDRDRDQNRVNRMAEHAIALRELAGSLERPDLTRLLDRLMIEIGVELARHLRDAPDGQRH